MRYLLTAAIFFVLLAGSTNAQTRDQNWAWCEGGDRERGIQACTDLIESGRETIKNLAIAHSNRGISYSDRGEFDLAIADYDRALELNPDLASAMNSLAWDLATIPSASQRDGPRAVDLAEIAIIFNKREPGFLDTLAAAYAEAGRFADAVRTQATAVQLLLQVGNVPEPVIEDFQSRLRLYQNNRPFHRSQ